MAPHHAASITIDFGLLVLIWIVQAVVYPSFQRQEPETFKAWHRDYTRRMGYIVAPLMIAQLATSCWLLLVQPGNLFSILHTSMVAGTWLFTFLVSVPLHKRLQANGRCKTTIENLVSTNWIRTITWTILFAIGLARLPAT